jgi:hypothetical protein
VKKTEEIMEILAAYDLTGSFRDAAALVGGDQHTVAHYVRARDSGQLTTATPQQRDQLIDPFRDKIEEWVDASHGRIRAVAQRKLEPMGYTGSERTTRRAVAEAKATYRAGHRRRFRPWLPEPGLWFQWDYADGPLVNGYKTWLWCAWLAWSRFRVVLPIRDKTLPTVIACIDVTLCRFGGVPTYGLSDNEKTLSVDHIARIAVRNPTNGGGWPLLWPDVGQLCAGGPRIEGVRIKLLLVNWIEGEGVVFMSDGRSEPNLPPLAESCMRPCGRSHCSTSATCRACRARESICRIAGTQS